MKKTEKMITAVAIVLTILFPCLVLPTDISVNAKVDGTARRTNDMLIYDITR